MTSRRLSGLTATPKYDEPDMYTLKLYYGGDLVQKPRVQYKDGRIEYFDNFSAEEGSILELRKMVKSLKFSDKKINFWFKFGSKSYPKVRQIKTDAELLSIMYEIPKNKEVEMFVEHVIEDQWDYEVEVEGYISDELWVESETDVPLEDWEFEVGDNVNVNAFVDATVNASVEHLFMHIYCSLITCLGSTLIGEDRLIFGS
nr:Zinc/iron permease [Ipomoea batatas]